MNHAKSFIIRVRTIFIRNLMKINFRPYKKPTIVFESFGGRQVSDSPYAIYEDMKINSNVNCVWSIKQSQQAYCEAHHIDYAIRRSLKWAVLMERAQVWVVNARIPKWVRKPAHVYYVQTWHGTPLKKLGLDILHVTMPSTTTDAYHRNFVSETKRWDTLISANSYSTEIFRRAFDFHNNIAEIGYPRNDKLINTTSTEISRIKQRLNIPMDKKVIMYAPTYRDNAFAAKGQYLFKMPFSIDKLLEALDKDTILILRMHYLIVGQLDLKAYHGRVLDFSQYHDISDLYLVSDLLITDYSSVFFDYAYLRRPIIFYPYDYHEYKDQLRGFYLNYEKDLPGEIAWNENDLLMLTHKALQILGEDTSIKMDNFYQKFCQQHSGRSSTEITKNILKKIKTKNKTKI
ncbi:CDP-glycerol poly(glycerophosphate) glycerophosphotransferase [Pediococcus ethanolidurans]|nr:CDP-glycerol poly(glycerophosphate) glycerophosphotransferase [Pediococcus ethanolidurans]